MSRHKKLYDFRMSDLRNSTSVTVGPSDCTEDQGLDPSSRSRKLIGRQQKPLPQRSDLDTSSPLSFPAASPQTGDAKGLNCHLAAPTAWVMSLDPSLLMVRGRKSSRSRSVCGVRGSAGSRHFV
ncbi:hypothetical protein U0070_000827 [Myodes glareolus]|uniref:Uncharacterized protein n=1 Tax=Myodes glareolus TaxID=447135 RepID=A0AAW0HL63_MYOGA